MTVNTTNITSGPYAGNDVADTFDYTFRVENETQLSVYETDSLGVKTTLTVDVDYTVAGIGVDGGGTITRTAGALPTGYTWYIRSNYIETQLTEFDSQGGFFPDVHESAFDKLTFLFQQILDSIARSFKITDEIDIDGNFVVDYTAAERAGRLLGFDLDGNLTIDVELATFVDAAESWAINPEDVPVPVAYGGDGLSTYSSYHWAQKAIAVDLANASFASFEYTASEGQTVFSGADDNALTLAYTGGNIVVSLNGNVLKSSDYTAADGTSVTLAVGANLNDVVQITAFTTYVMSSSYTKPETNALIAAVQADVDSVDTRVVVLENAPGSVGAMATMTTATQSIPTSTTTAVIWGDDAVNGYDDAGIWDVASPTKLVIPAGYTRARFSAQINWAFDFLYGKDRRVYIRKVGAGGTHGLPGAHLTNTTAPTSNEIMMNISSAVIKVTPGDEFEVVVWHDAGAAINIQNSAAGGNLPSHFSVEVFK